MDFICGAEALPEDRQLGKAWENVWSTNGFPQTHSQQQGVESWLSLNPVGLLGLELLHRAVVTDLDKVTCQQGLFKRSL